MSEGSPATGPHAGQPLLAGGAPLSRAKAGMVVVHGRGATAASMVEFADALAQPDIALLAPQAAGNVWYPLSFLAPLALHEPGLSSGLSVIRHAVRSLCEGGLALDRIVLLGFSQGACLALEYAARHPQRYGGVIGLSGGLIGNGEIDGAEAPFDKRFDYNAGFQGTPVFLGCSEADPHIPKVRVETSAEVLTKLGATVDARIYAGGGHGVTDDEVRYVRGLLAAF